MLSFKNIKIICLPLLSFEKIKLDIMIQTWQTLTDTSGDSEFTPVTLTPPALRITIQRQCQAKDKHKVLGDDFTRGIRRLRR